MVYKHLILWISLLFPLVAVSQSHEYSRRIEKVFPINNAATVDIGNKYGLVKINTWEKDSVSFVIDLKIQAKDKKRLEKIKKEIDFNFSSGQYFLIAHTIISNGSTDIIKDIVDVASTYFTSATAVSIDYTVYLPSYSTLKIENKFGDVYVDDLNGNFNLELSYGELKANRLKGKTEINLSSGDANIQSINNGRIMVSYSDIRINEADRLSMDSRSSNVTINEAVDLRFDSRRDKVVLGEIGIFSGESYFTDFKIDHLKSNMSYRLKYGELMLEKVSRSFALINLTSEYSDVELVFERPLNFNFELTHHQDTRFSYPKGEARLETAIVNAEEKQMAMTGRFGPGSSDSKVVIVASRKCNVVISSR